MEQIEDSNPLKSLGTYKPIMALNKDSFKEMQQFFVLKIIVDNPDGITAYQLSTNYQINRSTVKLLLKDFERNKYIHSKTEVIEGRNNKFYTLTEKGFEYLLSLKYKWFERFSMMEELTLRNFTNNEKRFYIKKIEKYKTQEEQLEYLRAMQLRHENNMNLFQQKYQTFAQMNTILLNVIKTIEEDGYLNIGKMGNFFDLVIEMDKSSENEK